MGITIGHAAGGRKISYHCAFHINRDIAGRNGFVLDAIGFSMSITSCDATGSRAAHSRAVNLQTVQCHSYCTANYAATISNPADGSSGYITTRSRITNSTGSSCQVRCDLTGTKSNGR